MCYVFYYSRQGEEQTKKQLSSRKQKEIIETVKFYGNLPE